MEKEFEYRFDSYCGIHCGSCFVLRSYKDTREILLIDPWSEWLKRMTLQCHGCKSDDVFENCKGCPRRPCAQEKGYEYCIECPEYPCDIYKEASDKYKFAHHEVAQVRMKILKSQGLESWLKYQKERFSCPNCGEIFTWYEKTCWKCGEPVLDSITEYKQMINKKKSGEIDEKN